MRNFMCIFLVVLLNQRVSCDRECYQTEFEGPCIDSYRRNTDHEKALSCLKELKEKKKECTSSKDTCIRVVFTYVDNDTLTFTDCDASQDDFPRCDKLMIDAIVGIANKKLKHKECEKCKTNMCNPRTKKVETTTILSKQNTSQDTEPPAKETNKSIETLPSIAVLIFVVLVSLTFKFVL